MRPLCAGASRGNPFSGSDRYDSCRGCGSARGTGLLHQGKPGGKRSITPIPPDVAVCRECVEELFDSHNPRYLYPFITCTLCGPRFTVVRSFPYDRERTSMADFTMCPRCEKEYDSPEDRRFHSQTNSCPECGPRLILVDRDGKRA